MTEIFPKETDSGPNKMIKVVSWHGVGKDSDPQPCFLAECSNNVTQVTGEFGGAVLSIIGGNTKDAMEVLYGDDLEVMSFSEESIRKIREKKQFPLWANISIENATENTNLTITIIGKRG